MFDDVWRPLLILHSSLTIKWTILREVANTEVEYFVHFASTFLVRGKDLAYIPQIVPTQAGLWFVWRQLVACGQAFQMQSNFTFTCLAEAERACFCIFLHVVAHRERGGSKEGAGLGCWAGRGCFVISRIWMPAAEGDWARSSLINTHFQACL